MDTITCIAMTADGSNFARLSGGDKDVAMRKLALRASLCDKDKFPLSK